MDEKLTYWGSVIFSALALVLMVVNISLSNSNRAAQIDVAQRQSTITGGQTLAQLNQGLVQAMAEAAYKNNNAQIRDLLTAQGITVKSDAPAATPAAPAAKSTDKK